MPHSRQLSWWDDPEPTPGPAGSELPDPLVRAADQLGFAVVVQEKTGLNPTAVSRLQRCLQFAREAVRQRDLLSVRDLVRALEALDDLAVEPAAWHHVRSALSQALGVLRVLERAG